MACQIGLNNVMAEQLQLQRSLFFLFLSHTCSPLKPPLHWVDLFDLIFAHFCRGKKIALGY